MKEKLRMIYSVNKDLMSLGNMRSTVYLPHCQFMLSSQVYAAQKLN